MPEVADTPELAYLYDGSLEGLLCAVFAAYEHKEDPCDVVTSENLQLRIGQELREIITDGTKAQRVFRGIVRNHGGEVFEAIKNASLSDDAGKGSIVYRYIRLAMDSGIGRGALINDFSHNEVYRLQQLNRSVSNERHYIMQFLRFEHLEGDLWFARCNPKASVVPLVMDWFSARFNTQAFIIYDEVHELAGVYGGRDWHLVKSDLLEIPEIPEKTADETLMQAAWKRFYDTVAVESRYNPELRRQFMPKRFWKNITEMKETGTTGMREMAGTKMAGTKEAKKIERELLPK